MIESPVPMNRPDRMLPPPVCWLAGALLLASACAARGASNWWNAGWPYRRQITVEKPEESTLDGDEIAVVTFLTGGFVQPDGRDVRVVTRTGQPVAHRVLQVGPGDRIRLAFATRGRLKQYFVYFGNTKANAPRQTLQIRRGVLLETWVHRGGNPRRLQTARKMIGQAKTLLGRDLRRQIALGHNPFGPQPNLARRMTGYFTVPRAGTYTFATSSRNASFLLIDGNLVVDNGGGHRPQRNVAVNGQVHLDPGLHEMQMLHVSNGGDPVAVVAWKPAGADRYAPMPPAAFAPFAVAASGPIERYGRASGIDFQAHHAGEAWFGDGYYQRYRFEATLVGRKVRASWRWDFGDGQSSTGPAAEHVYLVPGEYAVSLSARTPVGELTRTHRIVVTRPWDRVTDNQLDARKKHGQIVAGYDFARLSPAANAHAVLLLDEVGMVEPLQAAGSALLVRDWAPPALLESAGLAFARRLLETGRARQAAGSLQTAADMVEDPKVAARLIHRAGGIMLAEVGDARAAGKLFKHSMETYGPRAGAELARQARIGLADTFRAQGLRDQAMAAYAAAGPDVPARHRSEAIYRGDLARHVEAYLNEGKFHDAEEYLQRWAADLPADKINGYWSWMFVRLALARKQWSAAIAEAETLTGVNVRSNYGAKLLMLARQAALRLNQPDKADALLRRIVKEFPESPLAAEAARLLEQATP